MLSASLKGQDKHQRPDSASLAAEMEAPASDRGGELTVTESERS